MRTKWGKPVKPWWRPSFLAGWIAFLSHTYKEGFFLFSLFSQRRNGAIVSRVANQPNQCRTQRYHRRIYIGHPNSCSFVLLINFVSSTSPNEKFTMKHVCKGLEQIQFPSAREKALFLFNERLPVLPFGKKLSDSERVQYYKSLEECYKDPNFSIVSFVKLCPICLTYLPVNERAAR